MRTVFWVLPKVAAFVQTKMEEPRDVRSASGFLARQVGPESFMRRL